MKKFLIATAGIVALSAPAFAADMAVKARPLAVDPAYNWSGWYIGVNGGGGWAQDRTITENEFDAGAPFFNGTFGSRNASGGFGGGQVGYNWQGAGSPFVLGLEADIQGSDIRGAQTATITPYLTAGNSITVGTSESLRWFGTVRGRVGYAWDRFMVYATGGFAYGEVRNTQTMSDTFGFTAAGSLTNTRIGYVLGAGGEYAFTPNWSAKVEYQYIDLGRATIASQEFTGGAPSAFSVSNRTRDDYHTVRIGLNYKWGGPFLRNY